MSTAHGLPCVLEPQQALALFQKSLSREMWHWGGLTDWQAHWLEFLVLRPTEAVHTVGGLLPDDQHLTGLT